VPFHYGAGGEALQAGARLSSKVRNRIAASAGQALGVPRPSAEAEVPVDQSFEVAPDREPLRVDEHDEDEMVPPVDYDDEDDEDEDDIDD
jgi:hypothetical protein